MYRVEDAFRVEKELEDLRENLNKCVVKVLGSRTPKDYEELLDISKKLDEIIVNYTKSFADNSEII